MRYGRIVSKYLSSHCWEEAEQRTEFAVLVGTAYYSSTWTSVLHYTAFYDFWWTRIDSIGDITIRSKQSFASCRQAVMERLLTRQDAAKRLLCAMRRSFWRLVARSAQRLAVISPSYSFLSYQAVLLFSDHRLSTLPLNSGASLVRGVHSHCPLQRAGNLFENLEGEDFSA